MKSMKKTYFVALLFGAALVATPWRAASEPAQDPLAPFRNNSCVMCHSRNQTSSTLANRYLDWHLSTHLLGGVSCDACHGGDPKTNDKGKSHLGVLPSADAASRTSPANQPQSCSSCHAATSAKFLESRHYAAAKAAGGGPSCSTCHEHMASAVVTTADEGAALCARCHTADGTTAAAKHADVPDKAREVVAAFERADGMVVWADGLLGAAKDRKVDVAAEQAQLDAARAALGSAKADWHAFTLTGVRERADGAFEQATKAKDALRKKLNYN